MGRKKDNDDAPEQTPEEELEERQEEAREEDRDETHNDVWTGEFHPAPASEQIQTEGMQEDHEIPKEAQQHPDDAEQDEGQQIAQEVQEGATADPKAAWSPEPQSQADGGRSELIAQEIQTGIRSPQDIDSDPTIVGQDDPQAPVDEGITFNERHDIANQLTTKSGAPLGSIRSTPDGVYLSTEAARTLLDKIK